MKAKQHPLPLHLVPEQLLSIFRLIFGFVVPQQSLGLVFEGREVSAWAGGQITTPRAATWARGYVKRL